MQRVTFGLGLALLAGTAVFMACQRNAPPRPTPVPHASPLVAAASASPSITPRPTRSPTPAPSRTPTPTPTTTPLPTATPVPSARLAAAEQAFAWGDYARAFQEYAALRDDPGASAAEAELAAYWTARSAFEAADYPAALDALRDLIQTYPAHPQLPAAHFLMAHTYEELGDWPGAISAYQAYLETGDDILAPYAYEGMGNAAMLALDYDRAGRAYAQGLRSAPDLSWAVRMREGIAQSHLAKSDPQAAIDQYDAILSVARIPAYRARILYLAGQAHLQAGDPQAAYARYAQAINRYPEAYDSYLARVELVNAGVTVDDFQRGLVDYYAGAYQPAIEAFQRHIEEKPQAQNGDAHWYLARSLKANGNLLQALQQFQTLVKTYPLNQHVEEAWLETAKAHVLRDDIDQAIQAYRRFAEEPPQSPLAATALWEAAELEAHEGDPAQAAASFRKLAERYPEDVGAPDALFQAALLDYQRAEYAAARDGWQALIQGYPDSRAAQGARFWLGKAQMALDDPGRAEAAFEAARDWVPTSYYGVRAAQTLDGSASSSRQAELLPPAGLEADQAGAEDWLAGWIPLTNTLEIGTLDPAIASSPSFRRGEALLAVGRRSDALAEFDQIRDAWWDDPLALYQLALAFRDRGLYRLSIVSAERLTALSPITSRLEVPLFIQRLSFPAYYQDLVVTEAQSQGLDPLLVLALIRQESLFEPSSSSPADARGLTQVIPATGEWIAGRLGWGEFDAESLSLPYVNIAFGTWYLAVQVATFEEQTIPALAAFNAGPGHIHDWLEAAPDIDLFVETMPYSETQRYVRSTYENYAHYRRLYPDFPGESFLEAPQPRDQEP